MKNVLHVIPSLAICATVISTDCSKTTTTLRTLLKWFIYRASNKQVRNRQNTSDWENENLLSIEDCHKSFNHKDVFPTLEAMRKKTEYYYKRGIDMLKLRCTLRNLAEICLYSKSDPIFYPFTETKKDLLEKIGEDTVSRESIVFTRKAVVDELFFYGNQLICANPLWVLMLASFIPNTCVSQCLLVCIRHGSSSETKIFRSTKQIPLLLDYGFLKSSTNSTIL